MYTRFFHSVYIQIELRMQFTDEHDEMLVDIARVGIELVHKFRLD
jgi:hypothetical protein